MPQKIAVVTLVILGQIILFAVVFRRHEMAGHSGSETVGNALSRDPRIDNLVAALKKERPPELINNLITNDQQYFDPGFSTSRSFAQIDLEIALSSRRFIKFLQSVEKLSKMDREITCRQFFSKAFQAHTNAIYVILNHEDNPSSAANDLSLFGTKEAICEAMFIIADIGRLDLLSAQFAQIDQFRKEIEPVIEIHKSKHPFGVWAMLQHSFVPDRRFEVNVLRLAAIRSGSKDKLEKFDAQCDAINMQKREVPIVAWDARKTWFERPVQRSVPFDKIVLNLVAYDWAEDDSHNYRLQDETASKLRSIVLF